MKQDLFISLLNTISFKALRNNNNLYQIELKYRPVLHLQDVALFLYNAKPPIIVFIRFKNSSNPLVNNAVIRTPQYLL